MELEKRVIKGNTKKYKRKSDNKEIVKHSLYINLGVNSIFEIGDNVVILTDDNYNSIVNDNASDDTINQLNNEIAKLNNLLDSKEQQINELNNQIVSLNASISDKDNAINELNKEIAKYNAVDIEELQNKANELDQYKNVVIDYLRNERGEYKDLINYLNKCIDRLEHRNIFLRLINKDNTSDIDKPPLKLIDINGYILNDSHNDLNSIPIDYSNKSE